MEHGSCVTHDTPLRLAVESHDLAEVVYEADQLEPLLVGVVTADPLRGLEGVHDVGQLGVGVALVHQVVQHLERLHDGRLEVVELEPLVVLLPHEVHCLVGVHLGVGPLHPLPDLVLLAVVTECFLLLQKELRATQIGGVQQ